MKITKEQLKQIIKEELGGDYGAAMQMVNKFNSQAHLGDVEADLQEDDDGTILYRVVISMGTEEVDNFGGQVELERNIQSKINQLQSELSTRVDVFGDTIQIELQPKIQGIENLQSFLNDASSLSQEIAGGDVAQSDLPGVKESKIKITKEQLKQIILEEIKNIKEGMPQSPGHIPDTTSKIHTNPKLAGPPSGWLDIADRLKQMSRVWVNPEDGKMLELAGAILRSAFEQHSAESDAALGI